MSSLKSGNGVWGRKKKDFGKDFKKCGIWKASEKLRKSFHGLLPRESKFYKADGQCNETLATVCYM